MSFASIDDLRANLGKPAKSEQAKAYAEKMMHDLPKADVVDRVVFILQKVAGKRVLEFGATGKMHEGIVKAASIVIGVDREAAHVGSCLDGAGRKHCVHGCVIGLDLDDVELAWDSFNIRELKPEVILCGEVVEHLANPGWFLKRLKDRWARVPVVITVPNAFTEIGAQHIKRGHENVNKDHVAYYSYKTLRTLVERYGYEIKEFAFYNGSGPTAEGLIAVVE